jgi:ATP-dependent helicase HrpA
MNSTVDRRPAANPIPPITFSDALPVCARRAEISEAISTYQVVIICGETGSGKTTQLPKIALSLGRGRGAGGQGLIGHTQPRRIAASSVAKRIAQELNTPLGEHVGYKVRFQDRLSKGASVKLMTDGILLAETQTDPLLKAYDTLIIDEAHERSLNIDFLLGYLRQILPKRPDLKVIITSATIDAQRFATHFASKSGPATVIQVSGRTFPVEQRWRPFEESREYGLNDAIFDAATELWQSGSGDILVFLPGEREIREAADHLRRRHSPGVEIVPLYSRLSQAEQERVFESHNVRRIVLATNVAETSLTVPGIQYVIDVGTARVKRYSYRNKVEQLQIEPISQAAANQRAGRCGRVSSGICIRLYDDKDFAARPAFTDPEIMRSSLAAVILRMKSLSLGHVEDFPFLESPPRRAITDGYQLLSELGAVDEQNELTTLGRELARLPLDPRVGRMLLEACGQQALSEVLIIASAMSLQDVRDRPQEQAQAADNAHKKFGDERSEFLATLKLWRWLENSRTSQGEHKLSNRKQEQLLRDNFISVRRVREWRDTHTQLLTVVREMGWRLNGSAATYEQLHLAVLSGLLGNIGCKSDEGDWYLGARGIKFYQHPGSHLSKKPSRWVVSAELVETTRLYGRNFAQIEPQWLPRIACHLIKTQLLEPHWEKKAGEVIALERATLYGLVIYSNRRVNFGLIDLPIAREIFIREALVAENWNTRLPFVAANRKTIAQIQELEHKSRRQDVLVDDELIHAFYDQHLPQDICSGHSLERWYRETVRVKPKLLHLTREELMRHEAAGISSSLFPPTLRLGGVDCTAAYLHEPGNAKDGLTATVPLFALNQVNAERCEWLVPGMLKDKVLALIKTLHQRPRSRLIPLPDYAQKFVDHAQNAPDIFMAALLDTLRIHVQATIQVDVKRTDFKPEQLPAHLFMNFRVVDEHGRQLGVGRNLSQLKADLGGQARSAFQALAVLLPSKLQQPNCPTLPPQVAEVKLSTTLPVCSRDVAGDLKPHTPEPQYIDWTFGELPEIMEIHQGPQILIGFPALIDCHTHVTIEVFDEPELAQTKHRAGLRRLVALQIKESLKYLEKNIPDLQTMATYYMPLGTLEELREQTIVLALERAFLGDPLPTSDDQFQRRITEGRSRLTLICNEIARTLATVLSEYAAVSRKIKDSRVPKEVQDDIQKHLSRLLPKHFILLIPWSKLTHLPRYLRAIIIRLEKWRIDPARDSAKMAEIRPLEQRQQRLLADRKGLPDKNLEEFRWLLEELRVSLFAQELKTSQPVSVKRLEKAWGLLAI